MARGPMVQSLTPGQVASTLYETSLVPIPWLHRISDRAHLLPALRLLNAETRKNSKYAELALSGDLIFAPIAIETLGVWGPSALSLCADIGGRLARLTGDLRASSFLKQRLGLAVQRGNAAAVVGTHPQSDVCDI